MTTVVRGRWIPWTFAGGMLVVIAVNAVLITAALRSFPGLVVQRPYDRGIAYNEELRQDRAQAAIGWSMVPTFADGRLTVRVSGADGAPVAGLVVRATLSRPLEILPPVEATLAPSGDVYGAPIELPRRGQWEVRIRATGGEGSYRGIYRIVAP
ncbi:MAG: FixH family protein [Rhodospirillaceae bacterium]|nr:FixH family protein [Rhodospirillaceae bacterium]